MAFSSISILIFVFLFNVLTLGHPGHDHKREAAERAAYLKGARSLSHCSARLRSRGVQQRSIERRQALADSIRSKRGLPSKPYLKARDIDTVLATSHHSNLTSITLDTPETQLFAGNASCVLQPDTTEGPYYVTGELIRKNVTNGQAGVPLTLDVQIVDPTTCDILPNVYMDFWQANATGVYGGVVATGNGNTNDTTNLNNTAFRGIQQTDSEGVAQFETVVPGHYIGRTNHIHILTHTTNTTANVNGTINAVTATHVGQLYFDQSLLTQVEALAPYNTNTQNVTTNAEDFLLVAEAESSDPVVEYVLLGDGVGDGLLGWITVGIDPTEVRSVAAAANYGSSGGSSNPGGVSLSLPSGVSLPTTSAAFKV